MIALSSIVAVALVVAQGLAVWGFLKFVKSFGAFTVAHRELTSALLTTHESNLMIHQANQRILDELRQYHVNTKAVA